MRNHRLEGLGGWHSRILSAADSEEGITWSFNPPAHSDWTPKSLGGVSLFLIPLIPQPNPAPPPAPRLTSCLDQYSSLAGHRFHSALAARQSIIHTSGRALKYANWTLLPPCLQPCNGDVTDMFAIELTLSCGRRGRAWFARPLLCPAPPSFPTHPFLRPLFPVVQVHGSRPFPTSAPLTCGSSKSTSPPKPQAGAFPPVGSSLLPEAFPEYLVYTAGLTCSCT